MKKIFLKIAIALSVISFTTNSYSQTVTQSVKIGTFALYRTVTINDLKAYFGEYSFYNKSLNENYRGETVDYHTYRFDISPNSKEAIEISIIENRIEGFGIYVRDPKYAINGKLMVGDPISKISELGYLIYRNDYYTSLNYIKVCPPIYKRGAEEIYYYFEIYYDSNNIIKEILMFEDTGI